MSVRSLLAVSWCMPPGQFPRSIQVARLLKGLRAHGWESTVVTPRVEDLPAADMIDPELARVYEDAYRLAPVDLSTVDGDLGPLLGRTAQWWRGEDDLTQDELWVKRAARTALGEARRHGARVLVTFAQPWRDHLVGLQVAKKRPGVPWVAHFSDPWVDSLYDADLPAEERERERAREAAVVERADLVVFTNEYAAELVMAKYPAAWRGKARVVPHCMDRDLLPLADALVPTRVPGPRPLRIAHVGNLFVGRRTANAVFEALALLHRRQPLDGRLEFVQVGEGSGLYEARCRVFELALDSIVSFRSRVSHVESLAAMRDSDLLLLLDAPADTNVFMPSKVVDYLMADRPILAVTPARGASADIMRDDGHEVVEPGNVEAIAARLEARLRVHEAGGARPAPADGPSRFELAAVSTEFARLLDEATRRTR